jgi:hypothetical protein
VFSSLVQHSSSSDLNPLQFSNYIALTVVEIDKVVVKNLALLAIVRQRGRGELKGLDPEPEQ